MIASISGIRGILNRDISLVDFACFASNFATVMDSSEFLVARDTRSTGEAIKRAVVGALISRGAEVTDYGVISTPALFRESLVRKKPAIMITASHNEPEFNGLKFVKDGLGADEGVMQKVTSSPVPRKGEFKVGKVRRGRATYNSDLVKRFGKGSLEGVKVALDLGGGAAISHAAPLLRRLGCEVVAINDTYGIFNRTIDPMKDELMVLQRITKDGGCDLGLGFDCDGDRLVVVDGKGKKRTGDYTLTLAMRMVLEDAGRKDVVVSVDTTSAIDEIVEGFGGKVFRSKVGEANVVQMMQVKGVEIGGEGSSGGLIDGSFNYCRDSMLASLLIIKGLKEGGPRFLEGVRSYHQVRTALPMPRRLSVRAISRLAREHRDADTTDGVKIALSRNSWVLVRPSNTEGVVRISAEAGSEQKAAQIVNQYSRELKGLSR